MPLIKKLERELIIDWQKIQIETIPELKSSALRAYYLKLASYKKAKAWNLLLLAPL